MTNENDGPDDDDDDDDDGDGDGDGDVDNDNDNDDDYCHIFGRVTIWIQLLPKVLEYMQTAALPGFGTVGGQRGVSVNANHHQHYHDDDHPHLSS